MSGLFVLLQYLSLPLTLVWGGVIVGLCVHVIRSHREMFWLAVIIFLQPIGPFIYLVAIVLPDLFGGARARRLGQNALGALDPGREYREAQRAMDEVATAGARMRLAAAAFNLGRFEEAERLYSEAAQGIHADDPTALLGHARALLELNRPAEALTALERLRAQGEEGRQAPAVLAFARAYQGVGRMREAESAFQEAADRLPGLEAPARQAAFLAQAGRMDDARAALAEIDKRASRATAHFRREARQWRDYAAEKIGPA
ncbi:MAG: hypothetical protein JWP35_3179 [Caulobacter sp.]|nr:hypothetical protein [Caulobacter sp.]